MSTVRPTKPAAKKPSTRLAFLRRRGWKFYVALAIVIPSLTTAAVVAHYYLTFSRMIDARMNGEFQRTDPRIFARPLTVRKGQRVTEREMIDRLNDLGYAEKPRAEQTGEFAIGRDALVVIPRSGDRTGQTVRFAFGPLDKKGNLVYRRRSAHSMSGFKLS